MQEVTKEETPRECLTDDEIDSVITDEDNRYDFTKNQECMRKNDHNLLGP